MIYVPNIGPLNVFPGITQVTQHSESKMEKFNSDCYYAVRHAIAISEVCNAIHISMNDNPADLAMKLILDI